MPNSRPLHFDPRDKSPRAMFYRAHNQIAQRDEIFMEIMTGPNPLTPDDVARLIERDPARYGRYEGFARGR